MKDKKKVIPFFKKAVKLVDKRQEEIIADRKRIVMNF
jgi:ribosomal 30S subunit maturation factor RimM